MKNKMIIIIGVVLLLGAGLYYVTQMKNQQVMDGMNNPYGKEKLHQETIDILDDPLYQNIITPDDLDEKIQSGESVTVYYFKPDCVHCQRTTPVLVPLAEENDVDLVQMNLLEFDKTNDYNIEGTPTMVHYEDGKEIERMVGEQSEEDFQAFFDSHVNG